MLAIYPNLRYQKAPTLLMNVILQKFKNQVRYLATKLIRSKIRKITWLSNPLKSNLLSKRLSTKNF